MPPRARCPPPGEDGSLEVAKNRLPRLGDVVEVWWDGNQQAYRGKLAKLRGRVNLFRFEIHYDDGDVQVHNLNEEWWRFGDSPSTWYEPGEVDEIKRDEDHNTYHSPHMDSSIPPIQRHSPHRTLVRKASKEATRKMKERADLRGPLPNHLVSVHHIRCADGTDCLQVLPENDTPISSTTTTLKNSCKKQKSLPMSSNIIIAASSPAEPLTPAKQSTSVSATNICAMSLSQKSAGAAAEPTLGNVCTSVQTMRAIDSTLPPRKRKLSRKLGSI